MQKKNRLNPQESNWQETIKKEQRKDNIKKYAVWAVFGLLFLVGVGALVKMAGTSAPTSNPIEVQNLPKVTEKDIVFGEKTANVTLMEYADFQCPACASYNSVLNKLMDDYKNEVKFVYRFFPLTGIHKNALISGQAAYAAHKQGKFLEMKDELYENQTSWENLANPRDTFNKYAQEIGLDVEQFKKDMDSDEAKNVVQNGEREAISIGLNSTPTFFIGNKSISAQGYDQFKKLLDEELAKN